MLKLFLPNKHVKNIFEITPEFLLNEGKKGIIIDLDNTLIPWNIAHATDEVKEWLTNMQTHNISVIIFSNNNKERVALFSEPLNMPFIYRARKPLQKAFREAKSLLNMDKDEIVVIGDQLLTDILGGNRAGLYTILVVPIVQSDAAITKFNRRIERIILNRFYRKGQLENKNMERD